MYLLALSCIYCVTYLVLFFGVSLFFKNIFSRLRPRSILSLGYILAVYVSAVLISGLMPDPELSNRVLHTFGGGFLIVLVAFLAMRDSETKINAFQFFVVGVSVAALFGIANEILEFTPQSQLGIIFANSINDTWLDLVSNTVGSVIAGLILTPFVHNRN